MVAFSNAEIIEITKNRVKVPVRTLKLLLILESLFKHGLQEDFSEAHE